ncbi:MAG: amidohydrolase [Acidimicrobiaceae bacterium]|nr:amidohydrolase [Acidimicrobiaceae bacterium]|tara:strand:+ start:117742 stop:118746 length:1005 start_codon:yes stop_codon:yes gene_type:complete
MDLDRLDWINSGQELPIDSEQRIIDPHHHLWNRGGSRYLAEELSVDTSRGHRVTDTVFAECLADYRKEGEKKFRSLGETEFVFGESQRAKKLEGCNISGIIAYVDLALGNEVAEVLKAHNEVGGALLKGVRHATAWSSDPKISISHSKPSKELMLQESFLQGVKQLSDFNYSFDAWLYFDQLHELIHLAKEVPETKIIINHLGAPVRIGSWENKQREMQKIWQTELQKLSIFENIYLKVGGIGMENYFSTQWANKSSPPSSDQVVSVWNEKILWCIETFGTDKCMFESNYPVDRQTLPYSVIWNSFQRIVNSFSQNEKDNLFWRTAATVYGIGD